jgi:hypothetical protein
MSLFVRVEQTTCAGVSSTRLLFDGELVAIKSVPVTDFVLTDLQRKREFAKIADYSHWTESGLVLLLRLLSVSKPIPEPTGIAAGRVIVMLRAIGRARASAG